MEIKEITDKFKKDVEDFFQKGNCTSFTSDYLIGERIDLLLDDLRIASKERPEIQKAIEDYENNHYETMLRKAFKLVYDVEKETK